MRIGGKLFRSSDDTRLGETANRVDDRIKIQQDLNSLEQGAGTNKMKFSRDQCRTLFSGQVPTYRMREVGERPRVFSDSKWISRVTELARYFSHVRGAEAEVILLELKIGLLLEFILSFSCPMGMLNPFMSMVGARPLKWGSQSGG